jgi:SAM-dependent methyltransferase
VPDFFSRSEYRRLIAWSDRIRREAPFLDRVFGDAAERGLPRRFLDVGCGSGEHARHFAERGWAAVGIDISESMVESAKEIAGETEAGGSVRFELRDAADAAGLPEAPFGGALFVGNGTAFLASREILERAFAAIGAALAPGASLVVQTLNYERIERVPVRALPVNVRPLPEEEGGGEVVLVRVLDPKPGEGVVTFYPISLHLVPAEDGDGPPGVTVRGAKQVTHHAWKLPDFERALAGAGFAPPEVFGGMREEPFDPEISHDLVLHAVRNGATGGVDGGGASA